MPRKITDPYEVLGLDRGATEADVRTAYLRLAKNITRTRTPETKRQNGSSSRFRVRMRPSVTPMMFGRRNESSRRANRRTIHGRGPSVPAAAATG